MQLNNLDLGCRSGENGLNPELSVVSPVLLRRQDFPEDILSMVLFLLLLPFALSALRSPTNQHRRRVFYKGTLLT